MAILSQEEKVACSDLYYYATGERLEPHLWNASAAVILYEFIDKLRYCSKTFSIITNLPKLSASKKSTTRLYSVGKYIYEVWKDFQKYNSGKGYRPMCEKVGGYGRYPSAIQHAMIVGL